MSARILVVDDEEIVIRSCLRILEGNGYEIDVAHDGHDALRKVESNTYDVMILDIMMPNLGGMEVLRRVKETHPDVDVIMITGLSQIDTAVQAMKLGAFDYISKPFEPDELKLVVQRARERRQLLQENLNLKSAVSSNTASITSSARARRCRRSIGWSRSARPPIPPSCSPAKAAPVRS